MHHHFFHRCLYMISLHILVRPLLPPAQVPHPYSIQSKPSLPPEIHRPVFPDLMAQAPSVLSPRYRNGFHDRGKTSLRNRRLRQWAHSLDVCIPLGLRVIISFCGWLLFVIGLGRRLGSRVMGMDKGEREGANHIPSMISHSGFCTRSESG